MEQYFDIIILLSVILFAAVAFFKEWLSTLKNKIFDDKKLKVDNDIKNMQNDADRMIKTADNYYLTSKVLHCLYCRN